MFLFHSLVCALPRYKRLLSQILLLILGFALLAAPRSLLAQPSQRELLRDGSFENVGGATDWQKFAAGYEVDRQTRRNGDQSIRCDSVNTTTRLGAQAVLTLNQTRPSPILVMGWSKADSVGGVKDGDYSLYVD